MPAEVERKLAAILSADVVGYSRLMAEDDQGTSVSAAARELGVSRATLQRLLKRVSPETAATP